MERSRDVFFLALVRFDFAGLVFLFFFGGMAEVYHFAGRNYRAIGPDQARAQNPSRFRHRQKIRRVSSREQWAGVNLPRPDYPELVRSGMFFAHPLAIV